MHWPPAALDEREASKAVVVAVVVAILVAILKRRGRRLLPDAFLLLVERLIYKLF